MSVQSSTTLNKRKRDSEDLISNETPSNGTTADSDEAVSRAILEEADQYSNESNGLVRAEFATASVLASCHAAAVHSPAAARSVLAKHRASIDSKLGQILEIIGGYDENGDAPLHAAVRQGDSRTMQFLIAVGADLKSKNSNGETPLMLAIDDACYETLEHHMHVLMDLARDPSLLVAAAVAHCAGFSASNQSVPKTSLVLRPYQLDPTFLWAPPEARNAIYSWARESFDVQVAANTQPFLELPDDCAGDILEYLKLTMTRTESLQIATHCSSLEAHAWVRSLIAATTVAKATADLQPVYAFDNIRAMRECFRKGADMNVLNKDDTTALMRSSAKGDTAVVELLLEAGADIETKNISGNTALNVASLHGRTGVLKVLLEAGADIEAKDNNGKTSLVTAACLGCTDAVKLLLQAGANTEVTSESGDTPLIRASILGYIALVKLLLKAGADKDAKDENGYTALLYAAQFNRTAIAKFLVLMGADKNAKDFEDGNTALISAAARGHFDVVGILLIAGADIDVTSNNGYTALTAASYEGHTDIVEDLLLAGADTDVKDEESCTALMRASDCGWTAIVELLLEAGANMEAKEHSRDGDTALIIASQQNHSNVVELLLDAGADKDARNNNGISALMVAVIYDNPLIVEHLLLAGADMEFESAIDGSTALMIASQYDRPDIVNLLLQAGADKDAQNANGDTALDMANEEGHTEVAALLDTNRELTGGH